MADKKDDPVLRAKDSYRQLPVVASALNTKSDGLNASVKRLEGIFKKHPIGVASWVHITERYTPDRMRYHLEDVGFAKVNGKWCLALRVVDGDVRDDDDVEIWPFNEGPRGLRVKAVAKFPDLLEQLIKDGNEMIGEVAEQTKAVDALADALESLPEAGPVERRQLASRLVTAEKGAK